MKFHPFQYCCKHFSNMFTFNRKDIILSVRVDHVSIFILAIPTVSPIVRSCYNMTALVEIIKDSSK